jgi:hypothetical protein
MTRVKANRSHERFVQSAWKSGVKWVQMSDVVRTRGVPFLGEPWRYALAGALGGLVGWALVEPFFHEGGSVVRWGIGNAFFFPVVAGMISGALLLADFLPRERFASAASLGVAGFGLAFALGFLSLGPSHLVFAWLRPCGNCPLDSAGSGGFFLAAVARCLAWGGLGVVVGLGPGIVTGNWRKYCGAVMGGLMGGLIAGLSFDPLQIWVHSIADGHAWASRVTGFATVGGMAGFLTGVAGDLTMKSRLVTLSGALTGTQFVLDSGPCVIGSAPQCTVVLPEQTAVGSIYAVVQKVGFGFEIESLDGDAKVLVNGHATSRTRLINGDRIRIGETKLAFFSG